LEALRAGKQLESVLVATESHFGAQLTEIIKLAEQANIQVKRLPRRQVDAQSATKKAQGIIGLIANQQFATLDDILSSAPPVLMCVLDGVQDPQNLGAIARTLEVVGGAGLVIRSHKAVGVTPGAIRASAGALEHLHVVRVKSIPSTLQQLRDQNVSIVGLSVEAKKRYDEIEFKAPVAIVVGNEERGISREALAMCHETISIPQKGKVGSLNVSVASSLVFYEFMRSQA
jgi:23S rRNA (guanosine2251-2'-O)-methyltransferase